MSNVEKLVRFAESIDDDGTLIPAFLAMLDIVAVMREKEEADHV